MIALGGQQPIPLLLINVSLNIQIVLPYQIFNAFQCSSHIFRQETLQNPNFSYVNHDFVIFLLGRIRHDLLCDELEPFHLALLEGLVELDDNVFQISVEVIFVQVEIRFVWLGDFGKGKDLKFVFGISVFFR